MMRPVEIVMEYIDPHDPKNNMLWHEFKWDLPIPSVGSALRVTNEPFKAGPFRVVSHSWDVQWRNGQSEPVVTLRLEKF